MKYNFKNPLNNPRFKFGAYAVLLTIGVIVGVVLINLIISTLSSKIPLKLDLTQNKLFDLSPQTVQTVKGLKDDVNVYALYSSSWDSDNSVRQVKEYLERYAKLNTHFKLQYIDPVKNPNFLQQYQQKGENVNNGSIILQTKDKIKVLNISDLYSSTQNPQTGQTSAQSIQAEQKLTSALLYVAQGVGGKVYILAGHGQDTAEAAKGVLEKENYNLGDLNLLASNVPDDATNLVIPNLSKDLSDDEVNKLDKYFDKGGKAVFMFTAGQPPLPKLEAYLAEWGVTLQDSLVIETDKSKYMSPYPFAIFADMQSHDITTKLLSQKLTFIAPQSRYVTTNNSNAQKAAITSLLKSSSTSYAIKNYRDIQSVPPKSPGDASGPLDICVVSSRDTGSAATSPKLLVMAGSMAFDSQTLGLGDAANYDFLLNTFAWMTQKTGDLGIRAKDITPQNLSLSGNSVLYVVLFLLLVLIMIAGAGFFVWFRRRFK